MLLGHWVFPFLYEKILIPLWLLEESFPSSGCLVAPQRPFPSRFMDPPVQPLHWAVLGLLHVMASLAPLGGWACNLLLFCQRSSTPPQSTLVTGALNSCREGGSQTCEKLMGVVGPLVQET